MVGTFSQVTDHVEASRAPRIIRKKVWRNNEWQDLTKYQIQVPLRLSGDIVSWLTDTFGDRGWSYIGSSLTMDEDVYTLYCLRWG